MNWEKFNPLMFLMALGAGGISVIPFAIFQYTTEHGKGLVTLSQMGTDSLAFISEKEMESVLGIDNKASLILVKLSTIGTEDKFRKDFAELGISEDMKTWQEKIGGIIGTIAGTFNLLTMITTLVSLIIAAVIILVIIYINTVNKRKQIGILKAIGIDQEVIIFSYIFQALFYCIAGIFFGLLLIWGLTNIFTQNPIPFPMGEVSPIITFPLLAKSSISLLLISLIGGFLPSWQTARQSILDSIWG
ncbi:ABC transporter permease [archaeon]|jgi:putative ABC transport system permease protein|nr:ABC transporter permease [archaeon]MBT6824426.1 ABC transporter permease [archaeon]MBT7107295.1 ABC transporter permease [archaeon]MBT7297402.1 ABC transporter permease [archaeon]